MLRENISLEADNIVLSGQLYLPGSKPKYPAVCICHGIPSGKPPDPADGGYPLLAERICREGFVTLIFSFRGTGSSGGNIDLSGWRRDLKAAIDYLWNLNKTTDKQRLLLLGFSGGAAVSICVASQDSRVSAVAACACPAEFARHLEASEMQSLIDHFRDIGAIRDSDFPPSAGAWGDDFRQVRPIECVAGIAPRPLLLVHGDRDETVNISHAYRLYEKAGEPKRIAVIEGAGHRLRQNNQAMTAVIAWLKSQRDSRAASSE